MVLFGINNLQESGEKFKMLSDRDKQKLKTCFLGHIFRGKLSVSHAEMRTFMFEHKYYFWFDEKDVPDKHEVKLGLSRWVFESEYGKWKRVYDPKFYHPDQNRPEYWKDEDIPC